MWSIYVLIDVFDRIVKINWTLLKVFNKLKFKKIIKEAKNFLCFKKFSPFDSNSFQIHGRDLT